MFFAFSVLQKNSRALQWMSMMSYPLFLLHEPLIGGYIGACLGRIEGITSGAYVAVWIGLDLLAAMLLILVIKSIRFDRILWEYKI